MIADLAQQRQGTSGVPMKKFLVSARNDRGGEIRDESMNEVRRAHFAQSRKLIGQFKGREIKTIGDSFMAAFKSADAALDYSRTLQWKTGHPQIKIRAGIHIGPKKISISSVPESTNG